MIEFDLHRQTVRELNEALHAWPAQTTGGAADGRRVRVLNPEGRHALAAGLNAPIEVEIAGSVGYYCAGMNQNASVTVSGSAGVGVAENMMSGRVRIVGDVSQSAGATAHGGLLVVEGNASARCGISMKGVDIVVQGSVGPMSAFMGQAGNLVVLGDAGDGLGDSLFEAQLFVRGSVGGLGADCEEKPMTAESMTTLGRLLRAADMEARAAPDEFRRYGSARRLYHFHVDQAGTY